ncbi:OsmC family protein [Igneacidithiobacillus copahuensis]|uniref:OsmC family protein n=1 Tax=Igneacidithiobacillus copahuensis TaxID=2724909 RepID=UPI001D035CD2|nr:OsmC family protein [Igneacidithiobacillus copahuensis]
MTQQGSRNGVDVELLGQTVGAIQSQAELAQFQFRATTHWISGAHVQTHIQGFRGVGREDGSRSTPFILEGDEPAVLLGTNQGANAVELLLAALTSCLSVGVAYNAAARGIEIEELRMEVSGDIDLHGFLGLSESIRPGCQTIDVGCHIKSPASDSTIADLLEYAQHTSPVLDMIRNPTPVHVKFLRLS